MAINPFAQFVEQPETKENPFAKYATPACNFCFVAANSACWIAFLSTSLARCSSAVTLAAKAGVMPGAGAVTGVTAAAGGAAA